MPGPEEGAKDERDEKDEKITAYTIMHCGRF